jgi:hypothetical protein
VAESKTGRRLRKLRKGQWVRNMTEDEYELYKGSCDLLGVPVRLLTGGPAPNAGGPVAGSNVVGLFSTNQNAGALVPAPGRSAADGDDRVRTRLKRTRMGKRWTEVMEAVQNGDFTWDEFVKTLSPEELARGMLMDKNGSFTGRPPALVPRVFHDACIRELLARGKVLYKTNYIKAIEAMTDIASSKSAKESDRIKAATFVIERLEGKVPDKLEIGVVAPWQDIIQGIVAEVEEDQVVRAQEYLNRREDTGA